MTYDLNDLTNPDNLARVNRLNRERTERETAAANDHVQRQRADKQKHYAAFIERHRRTWTIAQTGVDPVTKVGRPTIEDTTGKRYAIGTVWEHAGILYREVDNPFGGAALEPHRQYQPKAGHLIWWDGGRSLRLFEALPLEAARLTREWIATQQGATSDKKGKRNR